MLDLLRLEESLKSDWSQFAVKSFSAVYNIIFQNPTTFESHHSGIKSYLNPISHPFNFSQNFVTFGTRYSSII